MIADAVPSMPDAISDSMDHSIEQIKTGLLSEYDLTGRVDVAAWVNRYPEYRDEIIDYSLWVKGTPRTSEMKPGPFASSDAEVADNALRGACLSVALGRQWLEATVEPDHAGIDQMASELEALRARPKRKVGKAPITFRKAVVWTWIVWIFQRRRTPVSRLAVQKATYLLESAMALGVFTEHSRKALGPYDYKARYKDAEPIAVKKRWLSVRGATLRAADDLSEVGRFVGRYLRSQVLAERFVSYLARFSDDELETLATVHWSAKEITQSRRTVNALAVKEALALTPEWRGKVHRSSFALDRIDDALSRLGRLRLL